MKKILMLSSVASMIGQFNMSNIRLLLEMKFKVEVACNFSKGNPCSDEEILKLKNDLHELDIQYYQIDFTRNVKNLKQCYIAYKQVEKLLEENQYEFIHCHSPLGGVIGRMAGKKTGTKVIYTAHGFHFYKNGPLKSWILYYPIEKMLSGCTDVLITINKEDFSLAKKRFKAKKVVYIPGVGISTNKIEQVLIERKTVRSKLGINDSDFVLISVGELSKRKNHKVILEALGRLKEKKIHYLICGKGDQKEELENLARRLGIESQIHILGYRTDVIELCKASDCFVFPSKREGLGIAALEGMASGLPLISSNSGGIMDYSKDGITGYCVGCSDIEGFTNAIKKLFNHSELCKTMGAYNQKLAKNFDICATEHIMRQIYKDIER